MIVTIFGERAAIKIVDARQRGDGVWQLLHSEYRWRKARKEHLKHEGCCQMCSILRKLEVHHIRPWHLAPDLRYESSNLITLCRECHFRFGHWLSWRSFNPQIRELCEYAQDQRKPGGENEEGIGVSTYDSAAWVRSYAGP
jgi:hypothetical protein